MNHNWVKFRSVGWIARFIPIATCIHVGTNESNPHLGHT